MRGSLSCSLIVLLVAGLLAGCRTTSVETPAWAFGLTLGEVLDQNTAQPMDALIAGRGLYRVKPPQPTRAFEDYALVTDRATGRMIGIVGWDRYSGTDACEAERQALAKVVERRYGPGKPALPSDRDKLKGLPESLSAGDLTIYPGWQGPVALGCAGPRLLLAYWYAPSEEPTPGEASILAPQGSSSAGGPNADASPTPAKP